MCYPNPLPKAQQAIQVGGAGPVAVATQQSGGTAIRRRRHRRHCGNHDISVGGGQSGTVSVPAGQ